MKRFLLILTLIFTALVGVGCESIVTNEIRNKAYDVTIEINKFEEILPAVIEKVSPAVLGVTNYKRDKLTYKIEGTGSGVVYKCEAILKDGSTNKDCSSTKNSNTVEVYKYYMITNKHVVKDADKLEVYLGDEDFELEGTLLAADDKVDLAVMSFYHSKYIQPVEIADSNNLVRGNYVIAIGHPGYDYYGSATLGIVSHPKRYLSDDTDGDGISDWDAEYIQHDAAINPGNSGGALVNIEGKLVGINTLKLVSNNIDNMGFAIPSSVFSELIGDLEQGIVPQRAILGVMGVEVRRLIKDPSQTEYVVPENLRYGLYITEVNEGIAKKAGLISHDIIIEFNGIEIKMTQHLRAELGKFVIGSGERIPMVIIRNNQKITVYVVF